MDSKQKWDNVPKDRGNSFIDRLKDAISGTQFWIALILLLGGIYAAFPKDSAVNLVYGIFTVIASLAAIRNVIKTGKPDFAKWIRDANTWNYLATIVVTLFPSINPDVFEAIRRVVESIFSGNAQAILIAVFSLLTILFKLSGGVRLPLGRTSVLFIAFFVSVSAYGQDFNIPEEEERPEELIRPRFLRAIPAQTNWGKDLLAPDGLAGRMARECKHRVHLKVADTGGWFTHKDLQHGQEKGASYTGEAPEDLHGHGTHVAGIVAGKNIGILWPLVQNNLLTFSGVKILNNSGSGSWSWVETAIMKELEDDQKRFSSGQFVVYNGSFGGGTNIIQPVQNALRLAHESGVVWVCANGNTGSEGVQFPGNSIYTIGTASLDQSPLQRSSFSSFGPQTDGAMPGRSINSTWKDNSYAVLSGTSMASPFMSAAAILALSKWGKPLTDVMTMRAYLCKIASDIAPPGKDNLTGCGIAFLTAILDTDPSTISPPPPPPPPPPSKPIKTLRPVLVKVPGEYSIFWNVQNMEYLEDRTDDFSIIGTQTPNDSLAFFVSGLPGVANGRNVLRISDIELLIKTTLHSEDAVDVCNKFIASFFAGRGLILQPNSDHNDAAYWTARFIQIIGKTNNLDVSVTSLRANDSAGRTVIVTQK